MNAGHDGEAGLHERPRQWARQYALFLDLAGLGAAAGAPASTPSAGSAEAAAVLPEGEKMRGGIKLTR
jgi:hypothetical protein